MRSKIVLVLLSIWVMALITPSVMTIADKGSTTYVLNINEEEQKEKPEHDADQKQLNSFSHPEFNFLPGQKRVAFRGHPLQIMAPLFEIILPPPEYPA